MRPDISTLARRVGAGLAGGIGVATLVAAPAGACHDGLPNADNAQQGVHENGLSTGGNTGSDWGTNRLDEQTDIHAYASTSTSDDIQVYDHGFAGGSYAGYNGYMTCQSYASSNQCDRFGVHFNTDAGINASDADWKWAGCHEFGHTGGLDERPASCDSDDNSCLVNGVGNGRLSLDSHDITTINGDL